MTTSVDDGVVYEGLPHINRTADDDKNGLYSAVGSSRATPENGAETNTTKDRSEARSPSYGSITHESRKIHRRVSFKPNEESKEDYDDREEDTPENEIEARKMYNNYLFGFRKWKSHVTSRPIYTRSEIVQSLYTDVNKYKAHKVSTLRISNVLYSIFIGWWLALIYIVMGTFLYVTIIGHRYATLCFKLAGYFFWPFGKFVYKVHEGNGLGNVVSETQNTSTIDSLSSSNSYTWVEKPDVVLFSGEAASLLKKPRESLTSNNDKNQSSTWVKIQIGLWMVLAVPILVLVHAVVFGISWFFIFTIPIAKINSKTIKTILFLNPDRVQIAGSAPSTPEGGGHSEIIMFTHQSFNWYYYKYTVDGMNVIFANLLIFVLISIIIGYADDDNKVFSPITKCILSILAVLPVTYYIGMAITSISAQSSFAVGAFLNATFGSIVEVILFVIMLKKGKDTNQTCYQELVKSTLTGSIMCCILLVPGMSMVVGGLKYRQQNFNPKSANYSSSLLFVAIIGVFGPTIFAKIYGNLECGNCVPYGKTANETGFLCSDCHTVLVGPDNDKSLYNAHVRPLVYGCAIILPIAYFIGLIFSMKTHNADIFEEFETKQKEDGKCGHHGNAQWSRLKSTVILLLSVTAISLSADVISVNIPSLLSAANVSEYFVGVTLLAIVSMLPELVNGIQFALKNNVNLSIEIGSAAAIQVCMVQLPFIVLADTIYPMGFSAVFNDIHLWVVVFSVIIINYVFQDGKSDYFQGSTVMFIYILLMLMYFFTLTPEEAVCTK